MNQVSQAGGPKIGVSINDFLEQSPRCEAPANFRKLFIGMFLTLGLLWLSGYFKGFRIVTLLLFRSFAQRHRLAQSSIDMESNATRGIFLLYYFSLVVILLVGHSCIHPLSFCSYSILFGTRLS